jgi:hypothetical protein
MTNPTGAFVYDIPDRDQHGERRRPGTLQPNIERNRRVLGKAVHAGALMRLHELWPEAHVFLQHHGTGMRRRQNTRVVIRASADSPFGVEGWAFCAPGDQFDRRRGIELAFRRALAKVREYEANHG